MESSWTNRSRPFGRVRLKSNWSRSTVSFKKKVSWPKPCELWKQWRLPCERIHTQVVRFTHRLEFRLGKKKSHISCCCHRHPKAWRFLDTKIPLFLTEEKNNQNPARMMSFCLQELYGSVVSLGFLLVKKVIEEWIRTKNTSVLKGDRGDLHLSPCHWNEPFGTPLQLEGFLHRYQGSKWVDPFGVRFRHLFFLAKSLRGLIFWLENWNGEF